MTPSKKPQFGKASPKGQKEKFDSSDDEDEEQLTDEEMVVDEEEFGSSDEDELESEGEEDQDISTVAKNKVFFTFINLREQAEGGDQTGAGEGTTKTETKVTREREASESSSSTTREEVTNGTEQEGGQSHYGNTKGSEVKRETEIRRVFG